MCALSLTKGVGPGRWGGANSSVAVVLQHDSVLVCARPCGVLALSVSRIRAVSTVFACPAPSSYSDINNIKNICYCQYQRYQKYHILEEREAGAGVLSAHLENGGYKSGNRSFVVAPVSHTTQRAGCIEESEALGSIYRLIRSHARAGFPIVSA